MSTPAIQSALQQLQSLATQAAGSAAQGQAATSAASSAFGGELQAAIQRINRLQQAASARGEAFQAGDPNVALNDVMVDMQKANIGFQFGLQVRNKLVSAYTDLMQISV